VITANWNASDGNEWTVPLGERPDGAASQQLRFIIALLYPTAAP
jgi:hypothetical protein